MNEVWGYTPSTVLDSSKLLGLECKEAKQVFSALLFKEGIKGTCVEISNIEGNPEVLLQLLVDDTDVLTTLFSPKEPKTYFFEMDELVNPITKIEVIIQVEKGSVSLPLSAIGAGMGFHKINDEFVPTNHLGLGLILP